MLAGALPGSVVAAAVIGGVSLQGGRGMVRPKPPIPALQGMFGKPTLVNNAMTLATVPMILVLGGVKMDRANYYEYSDRRTRKKESLLPWRRGKDTTSEEPERELEPVE